MDKWKEIWKDLKELYKDQKTELALLLLFLAAAIVFGVGEFSQQAVPAGPAESVSGLEAAGGQADSEEEMHSEDPESGDGNTETPETERVTEGGTGSEAESNTGSDTENETGSGTESLTVKEMLELLRRQDRRRLAALGYEFIIPMAMPEGYVRPEYDRQGNRITTEKEAEAVWNRQEGSEALLPVYTLRDTRELRSCPLPPLPEEEKNELQELLEKELSTYDGDWSVYVKNLKTGETALVNDRPMKSASVMKLFILGTVYHAFETGELERTDEIMSLVHNMITYSSNEDSNNLLYRLGDSDYAAGIEKVNAFIRESGFSDMTEEFNGFEDPATYTGSGSYNQVSAKDCGALLEAIYRREWVSRSVCNEIEQMMLDQNTRYKIPAGLPEGVLCGNKSGEMDTTENDAAIIYADSCDYILVVLSSEWSDGDEAIGRIRDVSAMVYEYFEEQQ